MAEDTATSVSSPAVSIRGQNSGESEHDRRQSLNTTIRSTYSAGNNDSSWNESFSGPKKSWQLRQTLEGVVKEINAKREHDASVLADFKKQLELQAAETYSEVEKALYGVYEETNPTINKQLEELFAVLDRIGKHEAELDGLKSNLKLLMSDIDDDTLGSDKSVQG